MKWPRPTCRFGSGICQWTMLLGLATGGCQPAVDRSELGNVIYRLPDVPGADTPYVLEPLEPPNNDDAP